MKLSKKMCLISILFVTIFGMCFMLAGCRGNDVGGLGRSAITSSEAEEGQISADVIIPDEEKVSWITTVTNYISDQQALDANFTYTLQGSGTEQDPYQISSAMDLAFLSKSTQSNNTFCAGKYYEITNDIVLNDGYFEDDGTYHDGGDGTLYEWQSVFFKGNNKNMSANFNGNGFTIYGPYHYAVFRGQSTSYCNIENLTVKNAYVESSSAIVFSGSATGNFSNIRCYGTIDVATGDVGGIVQTCGGEFSNCENYAHVTTLSGSAGGICYSTGDKFVNCKNYGKIESNSYSGGIVAQNIGIVEINYCKNFGNIVSTGSTLTNAGSGGIIGRMYQGLVKANHCENEGKIEGEYCCAGIMGKYNVLFYCNVSINKCLNKGEISGSYSGGIFGGIGTSGGGNPGSYTIEITACINYGSVSGSNTISCIGGIAGQIFFRGLKIADCANEGKITGGTYTGGIIGQIRAGQADIQIKECLNNGNVSSRGYNGGIIGELKGSTGTDRVNHDVLNCTNKGSIFSSGARVGGICGQVDDNTTRHLLFEGCKNEGSVICKMKETSSAYAGGLFGYVTASNAYNVMFVSCENYGLVKSNAYYVAGILAYSNSALNLIECENQGNVVANQYAYGIAYNHRTSSDNRKFIIQSCSNKGFISSTRYSYGIVNHSGSYQNYDVRNCCSFGDIVSSSYPNSAYAIGEIDNSFIKNTIVCCKVNNVNQKVFYGSDFSAFYVDRESGAIGLRALNSCGIFGFNEINETYLTDRDFTKAA